MKQKKWVATAASTVLLLSLATPATFAESTGTPLKGTIFTFESPDGTPLENFEFDLFRLTTDWYGNKDYDQVDTPTGFEPNEEGEVFIPDTYFLDGMTYVIQANKGDGDGRILYTYEVTGQEKDVYDFQSEELVEFNQDTILPNMLQSNVELLDSGNTLFTEAPFSSDQSYDGHVATNMTPIAQFDYVTEDQQLHSYYNAFDWSTPIVKEQVDWKAVTKPELGDAVVWLDSNNPNVSGYNGISVSLHPGIDTLVQVHASDDFGSYAYHAKLPTEGQVSKPVVQPTAYYDTTSNDIVLSYSNGGRGLVIFNMDKKTPLTFDVYNAETNERVAQNVAMDRQHQIKMPEPLTGSTYRIQLTSTHETAIPHPKEIWLHKDPSPGTELSELQTLKLNFGDKDEVQMYGGVEIYYNSPNYPIYEGYGMINFQDNEATFDWPISIIDSGTYSLRFDLTESMTQIGYKLNYEVTPAEMKALAEGKAFDIFSDIAKVSFDFDGKQMTNAYTILNDGNTTMQATLNDTLYVVPGSYKFFTKATEGDNTYYQSFEKDVTSDEATTFAFDFDNMAKLEVTGEEENLRIHSIANEFDYRVSFQGEQMKNVFLHKEQYNEINVEVEASNAFESPFRYYYNLGSLNMDDNKSFQHATDYTVTVENADVYPSRLAVGLKVETNGMRLNSVTHLIDSPFYGRGYSVLSETPVRDYKGDLTYPNYVPIKAVIKNAASEVVESITFTTYGFDFMSVPLPEKLADGNYTVELNFPVAHNKTLTKAVPFVIGDTTPVDPPVNPPVNPPVTPPTTPPATGDIGGVTVDPTTGTQQVVVNPQTFTNEAEITINATTLAADKPAELKMASATLAGLQANQTVTIETAGAAVSIPATLLKKLATQGSEVLLKVAPSLQTTDGAISSALDFKLGTNTNGTFIEQSMFTEPVTLELKLNKTPKDARKVAVFFMDGNSRTYMGGMAKDGIVTFETSHFSTFVAAEGDKTFMDLPSYAKDAVEVLASRGIINGKSETMYGSGDSITRAEFAVLVARALSLPTENYKGTFTDVPSNMSWAAMHIEAANKAGIINGYSATSFAPNEKINRQEMAAMIVRALKVQDPNVTVDTSKLIDFKDAASVSNFAKNDVAIASALGIIGGFKSGDGYEFRPQQTATRGEAAKMLFEMLF